MMDGCSFFGIYSRVILPVLKPALASVALLSFRGGWNEYILPLIFTMTNEKLRPLTVGVVALQNAGDGSGCMEYPVCRFRHRGYPDYHCIFICQQTVYGRYDSQGAVKG